MQGLHHADELLAAGHQLVGHLVVLLVVQGVLQVEHGLQLLQQVALRHLVRVHLQAEGCQPYLLHARLHHLQGRHLLSHEEHTLAVVEGVGDDVGDGLALARSRRSVEYEAALLSRLYDGLELRRVDVDGQRQLRRPQRAVGLPQVQRLVAQAVAVGLLLQQCVHDVVLAHQLGVVVYVVPHDELAEGEEPHGGFLDDVPSGVRLDMCSHDGEDGAQVQPAVVLRQWAEPCESYLELLSQHLCERGVEGGLLLAHAQHIAACALPYQAHGQHDQRGVARHDALLRLVPLQQSQCQEQRVGAVLLHGCPRLAVEGLYGVGQLVGVEV